MSAFRSRLARQGQYCGQVMPVPVTSLSLLALQRTPPKPLYPLPLPFHPPEPTPSDPIVPSTLPLEVKEFPMCGPVPPGTIVSNKTGYQPPGFLVCDGSAVSRITYVALFHVIGTYYGEGDGETTFHLPNLSNACDPYTVYLIRYDPTPTCSPSLPSGSCSCSSCSSCSCSSGGGIPCPAPTGASGATGPIYYYLMGPTGPAGEPGPAGPTGPSGFYYMVYLPSDGSSGGTGFTGIPGPQGALGPTGATGPAGAAGSEGPTGPAGRDGVDGATGPAGSQGADGATGAAGAAGSEGPTGSAGRDGVDGATGATGAQGPTGAAGAAGAEGPTGPTGAAGAEGPTGAQGPTGLIVYITTFGPTSTYAPPDPATYPSGPTGSYYIDPATIQVQIPPYPLAYIPLPGTILYNTYGFLPKGYLACDGTAVSRTQYSYLYDMVGTYYGPGDGSTTFNLPNLYNGTQIPYRYIVRYDLQNIPDVILEPDLKVYELEVAGATSVTIS